MSTSTFMVLVKAGYSVSEKAPILLLVFAVPATLAAVLAWRLARGG